MKLSDLKAGNRVVCSYVSDGGQYDHDYTRRRIVRVSKVNSEHIVIKEKYGSPMFFNKQTGREISDDVLVRNRMGKIEIASKEVMNSIIKADLTRGFISKIRDTNLYDLPFEKLKKICKILEKDK